MSRINGDKARFNRMRRQKIARRIRNREMLKHLTPKPKIVAATKNSEAV